MERSAYGLQIHASIRIAGLSVDAIRVRQRPCRDNGEHALAMVQWQERYADVEAKRTTASDDKSIPVCDVRTVLKAATR